MSSCGNTVYDQIWQKKGSPENIKIIEIDLKCSSSTYLKELIFGNAASSSFDGIHLRGKAASQHFTYRAIGAIKETLFIENSRPCVSKQTSPSYQQSKQSPRNKDIICGLNCPQVKYRRENPAYTASHHQNDQWTSRHKTYRSLYSDVVRGGNSEKQHRDAESDKGVSNQRYQQDTPSKRYSVPTSNMFSHLN